MRPPCPAPARSAMVRATRSTRWKPRADGRRALVRGAKGPATTDLAAAEFSRHRRDHGHLQHLAWLEGRQNARKTGGEQRLARAGRPAHQKIVATGGRDFQS